MTESGSPRRRRRRATARQGPPRHADPTSPANAASASPPAPARVDKGKPAPARKRAPEAKPAERKSRVRKPRDHGDRDLVGTGPSQVGPTAAMRARDLNRPTEQDLATAEAELVIVRRNWRPAANQATAEPHGDRGQPGR